MATVGLTSPWIQHVRMLEQMFKYDPEVHVLYFDEGHIVKLFVDEANKARAIDHFIKHEVEFGNILLKVEVIPSNTQNVNDEDFETSLYEIAFRGNKAFSFVKGIPYILGHDVIYVVFANKVVQYFADNIGDVYGQCSMLYQDVAKAIFEPDEGVFFCTDVEKDVLRAPLGEWP